MSRVFRYRGDHGFTVVGCAGETAEASAAVRARQPKKPDLPKTPGRIVGFAAFQSRRKQVDLHHEPRMSQLATCVGTDCAKLFKAAAEARGLTRGALLGAIIEAMVEDDLFEAVLDEGVR